MKDETEGQACGYDMLYDEGGWKLFLAHTFGAAGQLAGGMEGFMYGKKSVTEAQWLTASDEDEFDCYTEDGNGMYVIRHCREDGKCDRAWQAIFEVSRSEYDDGDGDEECHVLIEDEKGGEAGLGYLYGNAPEGLLALVRNDNPEWDEDASLLDYVGKARMLGLGYVDVNSILFCGTDEIRDYAAKGFYEYDGSGSAPRFIRKAVIAEGVDVIDDYAFDRCCCLESVEIPGSVVCIGGNAFIGCTALRSVRIPDSVGEIRDWAFMDCGSLESVEIPDSVSCIGESAFQGCKALATVRIPDSVTEIKDSTFRKCTSLRTIRIPGSVREIWGWAFSSCKSLESVEIPDSVTELGQDVFERCKKVTVHTDNPMVRDRLLKEGVKVLGMAGQGGSI